MRVRLAPSGEADFLEKFTYLHGLDDRAARALLTRVEKALRRLARYPHAGRVLPEFPELPYREVVLPPYRFVYRVQDDEVWIVAVWHTAQAPSPPGDG